MHRLVDFSLRNRFLVLASTVLAAGLGVHSMLRLPIDAVPDVTPNQVMVLTQAPGIGPTEVEQFVTVPVETALSGLPGITAIRSVSRFGLSSVYVYFEESVDLYFARRLVMERLPAARDLVPDGYGAPTLGPISTGLGEIYQFEVRGDGYSAMDLRTLLDWEIGFKLRSVPGVVEVNSYGGELKTYEIQLDPNRLVAYGVSLGMVVDALRENNANTGGAYIERAQEQYVVRGEGLVATLQDVGNIVVTAAADGTPVTVRNLGRVAFAPMVRQGAVTRDGRGEVVTGVVMMLMGENPRVVARRVDEELARIARTLPPGVEIETYYDRNELVQRTIATVQRNLAEGGLLVIAVLLLFLGNVRGGLIVAAAIPLSMLFAFTGMVRAGISGNLMSLGAIDFGLIVDGSVVMIENIVRRLDRAPEGRARHAVIAEAGREVARPVFFAVMIITVVYLPILTLQGVEGKMFRPMALTVVFALLASLVLALTLMPVLASLAFRRGAASREPRPRRLAEAPLSPPAGLGDVAPGRHRPRRGGALRGVAGAGAVHGRGVPAAPQRGGDRRPGVAPAERGAVGVHQEHDPDRAGPAGVPGGPHGRVAHGPGGDPDRSDGGRDERHLRHPDRRARLGDRRHPRGTHRGHES